MTETAPAGMASAHGQEARLYAVFSPWGNQWYKLSMFAGDLKGVNLLVSMRDVLCASRGVFEQMVAHGVLGELERRRATYGSYFRKNAARTGIGQEYLRYLDGDFPTQIGSIMVDSGGFGLTRLLARLPAGVPFEKRIPGFWARFVRGDAKAQNQLLELQKRLNPEIAITLDKVMLGPLPLREKKARIRFNLNCARRALIFKQDDGFKAGLFAAVHAYSNGTGNGDAEALRHTARDYMNALFEIESGIGTRFDGFSVGSMVPISSLDKIQAIAQGISEACGEAKRRVVLHGLGISTPRKMRVLYGMGFSSFDTNQHLKLARNRYVFTSHRKLVPLDKISAKDWACDCQTCRIHSLKELRENRATLKEVGTVLSALHNFHMGPLAALQSLAS